jgi:hypothetical protein
VAESREMAGRPPMWARGLVNDIDEIRGTTALILRKVQELMTQAGSASSTLEAQLTAIVQGLLPEVQKLLDDKAADAKTISDLTAKVSADDAEVANLTSAQTADAQGLQTAVDSLKTLVEGPTAPAVTPVAVADVPAVADGSQPVTDTSGAPVQAAPASSDPTTAAAPADPAADPNAAPAAPADPSAAPADPNAPSAPTA